MQVEQESQQAEVEYFERRVAEAERARDEAEAKVAKAKELLENAVASYLAATSILELMRRNLATARECL